MDEEFVVCPFNKSHIISRLRIQYHLIKCRKQYPFSKKVICPYDATEYIDPINFTAHLYQCKSKRRLDVSEEFRQKQYELIQHGDSTVQTFFAPGVEVTNEWDVLSDSKNNDVLPRDEMKEMTVKYQTSIALQKACAFSPVILQSVGRGRGNDLYQNYIDNLQAIPENSSACQSVSYFPNPDKTVLNEKVSDVSCEEKNICANVEVEVDEKGIFDDAEEPMNSNEDDTECKAPEKSSIVDSIGSNDNQKNLNTNTLFKYYESFMGRGSNKSALMMGRGAAIRRTCFANIQPETVEPSCVRPLDHVLKEVILNEMPNRNLLKSSNSENHKETSTQPSETSVSSDLSRFADYEENSNESKEHSLSSDSLNINEVKSPKSSSCVLDDSLICFTKSPRVNLKEIPSQGKPTRKSLDSLLSDIVKKLPTTSLEERDTANCLRKIHEPFKEENDSLKNNNDYFPVGPCLGRGHMFKGQRY